MVSIDVHKVRGKMAENGYTITSLSACLGIDRNTLSSYLKNPRKMPYSVVADLAALLCDTTEEANSIFFADNLRNTKDNTIG